MIKMAKLRIPISRKLLKRMDDAIRELGITRKQFAQEAITRELNRLEIQMVKEEIALHEIQKRLMAEGQSVRIEFGEDSLLAAGEVQCDLCCKLISRPVDQVEGPYFCGECLEVAKGGDFTHLEL